MKSPEKIFQIRSKRYIDADIENMWMDIEKYGKEDLCLIVILKGGIYVAHQLLRLLCNNNPAIGYLGLSSYNDKIIPEKDVKVSYPLDLSREYIENKNVWIIDDIVQSGSTLEKAKSIIKSFDPKSIRTAVLVDKATFRTESGCSSPDVVGYVYTGNKFLVGCGLDYCESYRSFPALYTLEKERDE